MYYVTEMTHAKHETLYFLVLKNPKEHLELCYAVYIFHLLPTRYADMDGSNRRIVMNGNVPHPFAITLFEDYMYWTDWNHLSIEKANKYTGENHTILQNLTHRPMDIHIFHPLMQKKGNIY